MKKPDIATANGLTRGQESAVLIKVAEQMNLDDIKIAVEGFLRGDAKVVMVKHFVDLATPPRLPFETAEVIRHEGSGVVEIELRSDDNLYIDGKKVVLHLSERQKGDKGIVGYELRQEIESGERVLLNSNVKDYLYGHPELFPKHWKKNQNSYIFFWGSIFRDPADGRLYTCCLCLSDDCLDRFCHWLGGVWRRQALSASVVS